MMITATTELKYTLVYLLTWTSLVRPFFALLCAPQIAILVSFRDAIFVVRQKFTYFTFHVVCGHLFSHREHEYPFRLSCTRHSRRCKTGIRHSLVLRSHFIIFSISTLHSFRSTKCPSERSSFTSDYCSRISFHSNFLWFTARKLCKPPLAIWIAPHHRIMCSRFLLRIPDVRFIYSNILNNTFRFSSASGE